MDETKRTPPVSAGRPAMISADKIKNELMGLIARGEIRTFSEARQFMEEIKTEKSVIRAIMPDIFILIKELYWGYFARLSKEKFTRLWHELVVQDNTMPEYGDLKQYMLISKIFIAILDIHGYTGFCQDQKNNFSMLRRLDEFITTKIYQCAETFGVIAGRELGDSVILIGADATAILAATLGIINLFSKERKIDLQSKVLPDFFLPTFRISAGIAGGKPLIPLIITEKGVLSGSLLNSAARLQTRAGALSPTETKIIIEQYVMLDIEKTQYSVGLPENLNFFYNGEISFKGVIMKNFEVYLYNPSDHYKSQIQDYLTRLQDTIKENQWQSKVFTNLCDLVSVTAKSIAPFYYQITVDRKPVHLNNQFVDAEFRDLKNKFISMCDFQNAIDKLGFLCRVLQQCEAFDKLVVEYCENIHDAYQIPLIHYNELFRKYMEENGARVFTPDESKIYQLYNQLVAKFSQVMQTMNSGEHLKDKRMLLWNKTVESVKKDIEFMIYSGKK